MGQTVCRWAALWVVLKAAQRAVCWVSTMAARMVSMMAGWMVASLVCLKAAMWAFCLAVSRAVLTAARKAAWRVAQTGDAMAE